MHSEREDGLPISLAVQAVRATSTEPIVRMPTLGKPPLAIITEH
jgi:hypothetical protein